MLLANGTVVHASEHDLDPSLFNAGRVGLGALGIMLRIRLRVVPQFKLQRVAMPYDLNQLQADLPALYEQYDRMQWYWTPYTNNATLLLRIPVPIDTPIVPCWPGDVERSLRTSRNVTCVDWSFKALCHEADDATLYTEMEYFVNVSHGAAIVADFRAFQDSVANESECRVGSTSGGQPCALFTGVRYGKQDEMWMSQMYGRDIAVVSTIVLGTATVAGPQAEFALYAKSLEKIAGKYGGRPHWGKMNWATVTDLQPQYPRFDAFVALRAAVDPNGMFLNRYLRRILGL